MTKLRAALGAIVLAVVTATPFAGAFAQPFTPSHIEAAIAAYQSLRTDEEFDFVLPGVAEQVAGALIQQRPDLHRDITAVVFDTAFALASQRNQLTIAVAEVWAAAFTEEELRGIAAFYEGPIGQKLAEIGEDVVQATGLAVRDWSRQLGNLLLEQVLQEFARRNIPF